MRDHDIPNARPRKSPAELMQQDEYSPEELSGLFGVGEYAIRRAVREGDLPAFVAGEEIVRIRREDALAWLRDRDAREEPRS